MTVLCGEHACFRAVRRGHQPWTRLRWPMELIVMALLPVPACRPLATLLQSWRPFQSNLLSRFTHRRVREEYYAHGCASLPHLHFDVPAFPTGLNSPRQEDAASRHGPNEGHPRACVHPTSCFYGPTRVDCCKWWQPLPVQWRPPELLRQPSSLWQPQIQNQPACWAFSCLSCLPVGWR